MLFALVLALLAALSLGIALLQRQQARKASHRTYFSQTLGVSEPPATRAEDGTSRPQ